MKLAYTISTANYLHQAKVVGDSLLKYNEGYIFIIYLFDKIDGRIDVNFFAPLQIVEVEDLTLEGFHDMVSRYSVFEACNALKPFVADYILKNKPEVENLVYVDSDLLFYNSISFVEQELKNYDIVLTPHAYTPMALDGKLIDEKTLLNSGIYNGGFLALKRSDESMIFLKWWKDRLRKYCLVNFSEGLFVDQIWLNLVPLYFKNVCVLKDDGYNVAFWNLFEREMSYKNGYFINQEYPLVFFHFSGYQIDSPEKISKHQNRYSFETRPDIINIFNAYKDVLIQNGYEEYSKIKCYYVSLNEERKLLDERKASQELRLIPTVKRIIKRLLKLF